MIDHLLGRPSSSWKRTQVALVLLFWYWRLKAGDPRGPFGVRSLNKRLSGFTPWQLVVAALTALYGIRHWDTLLGLNAPEPLARLYSRGFYRATWINTALDAGFATAAPIRVKWVRDIASMLFSGFYLGFADQADEKLRKYRAMPTVELMRVTWEKTANPYIQFATRHDRPRLPIRRKIVLPRPDGSKYTKPVVCWLWFSGNEDELVACNELIFDIPGGGFIALNPLSHEERIVQWAQKTRRPVLSLHYCKSPEYPFPYALDECIDVYRLVVETKGRVIGLGRDTLDIFTTGDSAGANLNAAMVISILEAPTSSPLHGLRLPAGMLWLYPALDFNYTSWMSSENLRLLRRDKSVANLPEGILEAKKHLDHRSPLSVHNDHKDEESGVRMPKLRLTKSLSKFPEAVSHWAMTPKAEPASILDQAEPEDLEMGRPARPMRQKSIGERVLYVAEQEAEPTSTEEEDAPKEPRPRSRSRDRKGKRSSVGTHLTMTSRTSFFNDRIISPSMMRCMAICYIGPRNAGRDLTRDYYISPIFAPANVLARFPPLYLLCGEKDPFVDDTVLIAGKIKEAKRARRAEAQQKGLDERIVDESEEDWVQTRVLEGWSHGFALMFAILPEVRGALDLAAGFISGGFRKPHARPVASARALAAATPRKSRDEGLLFTPRRRGAKGTDSRPASPSPALLGSRQPSSQEVTPALSSGDERPTSASTSPRTPSIDESPTRPKVTPTAAATATTPKEGAVLDSADTLLSRRRDEAGYGIPAAKTPDQGFRQLPELAHDEQDAEGKLPYVGEDDMYHRRRQDAVYGIPTTTAHDEEEGH